MRRGGLRWWAHRAALAVFRRLPVQARRTVVRVVAPTYTAGAMVRITGPDGRVLLIRQTYRRGWGLPGGLLGKRESPADAACREVFEEVGLVVELLGPAHLVMDLVPRRLDFVFDARTVGPVHDPLVPCSPELSDVRWFPPEDLPELQAETAVALESLRHPDRMPFPGGTPVRRGASDRR